MAGSNTRKCLALLVILLSSSLAVLGSKHGPKYLQLYAHGSLVPPTETFIVSVAPSGNKTGADEFGLIRTVSNILRAGRLDDSMIIGSQVGILVVGTGANLYISYTYHFNENATYQGTIAVHGHIDGAFIGDRVFAVVGGTGDFLSVTGEDRADYDTPLPPNPASILNVHNLTLHYSRR